ncbi:MAG: site-2 protease family protein [Acidobacteriota bacterium]
MHDITPEFLLLGVVWFAAFLFSVTLHEAAHAWAALRLGDPTAYEGGQVTLDPTPHVARSPFGTIVVPLLSYGMAGWMMGWASAPYDPLWAARHPRRAAWMALAGPVSNLIVVILSGLAIRAGLAMGYFRAPDTVVFERVTEATAAGPVEGVAALLSILFVLNLLLFAFNLLPLPPLDGASILPLVMPERLALRYLDFMRQPGFGLLGLVLAWRLFGELFSPLWTLALTVLYPGMGYA